MTVADSMPLESIHDLRAWMERAITDAHGAEYMLARLVRQLFEEWDAACEECEAMEATR